MMTRRRFLIAAAGAGAGLGSFVYTRRIEPRWLDVTTNALALPAGTWSGPPLRIVHLSDLHYSPAVPLALIDHAITLSLAQKPDLICLTGDFVTENDDFDADAYAPVLARLAAACPTFAILGNHDGRLFSAGRPQANPVSTVLERAGIPLVHNRATSLVVRQRRVHLVGLGDWWRGECAPALAFRRFSAARDEPVVALCHNPDAKDTLVSYPWHALLCGHTHGGQCGLPFVRAALAPVRDKRYLGGAYRYQDRWLHITRGVGNLFGLRIFCRPEVSVLTLA
jgi:uncharacterized protein